MEKVKQAYIRNILEFACLRPQLMIEFLAKTKSGFTKYWLFKEVAENKEAVTANGYLNYADVISAVASDIQDEIA